MFKCVEILCLHQGLRDFAPHSLTDVRQRHLTCAGCAKKAFQLVEFPSSLIIFSGAVWKVHIDN